MYAQHCVCEEWVCVHTCSHVCPCVQLRALGTPECGFWDLGQCFISIPEAAWVPLLALRTCLCVLRSNYQVLLEIPLLSQACQCSTNGRITRGALPSSK